MDPELKHLLEENLAIAKESNELLHKIVRGQRWERIWRIVYWSAIIGASVGLYYWLQPYLNIILGNYDAIMESFKNLQKTTESLPDASVLGSILDKFNQSR